MQHSNFSNFCSIFVNIYVIEITHADNLVLQKKYLGFISITSRIMDNVKQ